MVSPFRDAALPDPQDPVRLARAEMIRAVAESVRKLTDEVAAGSMTSNDFCDALEALRETYRTAVGEKEGFL